MIDRRRHTAGAFSEFDVIARYFTPEAPAEGVVRGVGDDAAVVQPPPGTELVVTTDTMIEGVHFRSGDDPSALGHKVLAVNLSDLAAMGAEPRWFTLALTLPAIDADWLARFSAGLGALAARHDIGLIGGDTTRGALSLTVQALGTVPAGTSIGRDGARPGDRIYVTGTIGDAGLALKVEREGAGRLSEADLQWCAQRLGMPVPRVREGMDLRGIASSCIDVSDGLIADLGHLLARSRVGARVELDRIPRSDAVRRAQRTPDDWNWIAGSGDDYELLFTVAPERVERLEAVMRHWERPAQAIGEIVEGDELVCVLADGARWVPRVRGYQHF